MLTAQQDFFEAETLLQDCLKVCNERGELWLRSYARWILSIVQLNTNRTEDAVVSAREALRIKRHFHDVPGVLLVLETIARLSVAEGRVEQAAYLLGASEMNWKTFGLPQMGSPFLSQEYETSVKECVKVLGRERYRELHAEGAKLSLEDTIATALDEMELPEESPEG
ncbi:hypothetical protein Aph01nite_67440 [Acrocarpospora phusangensis]|uniref:MalT-like TPR region domain-containing protein n=1 Tax=Acrocarpospora phusangensis TaxID=1070424 RepID=A0A919QI47_9ACTN|nr:hypothetical protein Aph01nite_67440 [Acrocarpospora phusangensis]